MSDPAGRIRNRRKFRMKEALAGFGAIFLLGAVVVEPACGTGPGTGDAAGGSSMAAPASRTMVKLGIEVLLEKRLDLIRGKKIGLVTNPSGVNSRLESTIALLNRTAGVELVALYGPEHGVRGDAQAGEYVAFYQDKKFGLPVFSLYGPSMKLPAGMLTSIDEYMRSFDTTHEDKKLKTAMTKGIDALLFDIQDVGTRVYTYQATMAYAMQACAESGIEFIVLDRPNPVGGEVLEGPVLEYPEFSSFVGLYSYPLRFGMTLGELARLFNDKFLEKKAKLTVVPMEGWSRGMSYAETGLFWVAPSPNMPTPETAIVYPGQVFLEGTNLSEGRGTAHPFEFFGAPWIDGYELAASLNALRLPGVIFREQWFTPTFSKFKGELCGGCQLHVTDRNAYRPLEAILHVLKTIRDTYAEKFEFHAKYFDTIMGTTKVRLALEKGTTVTGIVASWQDGLRAFEELRRPYLLY
jgi:uncharacterized protein YbbC (DUF1343 family)